MKNILTIIILLITANIFAQRTVEKSFDLNKNQTLDLNFKFASEIEIKQWDKNQVSVKATVTIDDGEGNEYFSLETDRHSNEVAIYSDFGGYFKKKNRRGFYDSNYSEINYTVYVPKGTSLRVESICGSLFIDSYYGDLRTDLVSGNVTLKKYEGEMRLETVSGDLDLVVEKAYVDASTVTGSVYSNLDIEQKSNRSHASHCIKGSINNGTERLRLTTVSGNIYLRKE